MLELLLNIKKTFLNKNFFIFIGIGIFNTFNGVWISYLLSCKMNANFAFVCGYLISLCIAYLLNANLNFKKKASIMGFIKFSISYIPNFIIQNLTVIVVYNICGLHKLIAYMFAAIIGIPITYLFLKFFAFAGEDKIEKKMNSTFCLLQVVNEHPVLYRVGIFCFFCILCFIANWSILLGENLMKNDIWNGEYPLQVMMSDALAHNSIPMWNPLMQFGTPYYAILGMPIWYPITLFLAMIGYTPRTVAISYVIHIAIGGFGMYLLAEDEVRKPKETLKLSDICVCLIAGSLYCCSGVFLSNAQHIMIIISAAWVPYVFYFAKFFIQKKRIFYAMMAGMCAGLILLGGYPEIFYDLFLYLAIYMLFIEYKKEKGFLRNLFTAVKQYLCVCIFTIIAGSISLLPFLKNMGLIIRGNGLGQVPNGYTFSALLSVLFPRMAKIIRGQEPSMINYYMGIFIILLIPMFIKRIKYSKKLYIGIAAIAFLLCWGQNSFIHAIFYRFLPMYDSFRFPTLNRIFLSIFILLLFIPIIKDGVETSFSKETLKFSKFLFGITVCTAIVFVFLANFLTETSEMDVAKCHTFAESAFIAAYIIGFYLIIFWLCMNHNIAKKQVSVLVLCTVCLEVLTFCFAEMDVTVTKYNSNSYSNNQAVHDEIEQEFTDNENRVKDTNFAGHKRSTNNNNSKNIVFNKTFDEDGYLSFLLQRTSKFKHQTYLRSIMEQNPVAYFTNDVVTSDDVVYDEWSKACDVQPEQIFVEENFESEDPKCQEFQSDVLSCQKLDFEIESNNIMISGPLCATNQATGHIRLIFDNTEDNTVPINVQFYEDEVTMSTYDGDYQIKENEGQCYVDVYFPDISKEYQRIRMSFSTTLPVAAELVITDRMAEDEYVDVNSFGFNSIGMTVDAPTEGYMTLLQAKHDGWVAYVDGQETEITLVDQCFMGIYLKPGTHEVVMRFRPKEFLVGAIFTGGYIVALILAAIAFMFSNHKRKAIMRTLNI